VSGGVQYPPAILERIARLAEAEPGREVCGLEARRYRFDGARYAPAPLD
jgi:hypothetical protein